MQVQVHRRRQAEFAGEEEPLRGLGRQFPLLQRHRRQEHARLRVLSQRGSAATGGPVWQHLSRRGLSERRRREDPTAAGVSEESGRPGRRPAKEKDPKVAAAREAGADLQGEGLPHSDATAGIRGGRYLLQIPAA